MGKTEEAGIGEAGRFGDDAGIVNEWIDRRVVRVIERIQEVGVKL